MTRGELLKEIQSKLQCYTLICCIISPHTAFDIALFKAAPERLLVAKLDLIIS